MHLVDRNGNTISLHYPAYTATGIDGCAPRPLGLTDSAGRKLRFTWSEDLGPSGPLLQEIHLESRVIDGVEQVGGLLARYAYGTDGNVPDDAHANLQSATDAMGGVAVMAAIAAKHMDEPVVQRMQRFARLGTIDLRVDFLRQGIGEVFSVQARVLRLGSRVASTRMEFLGEDGTLLTAGAAAYIVS